MPKKKVEPKIDAPLLKCGTVAIIGRPNVGKSTLLNTILGEKISIVSNVPQTTRSQIRGIFTDERGQIIFIDTPGMHLGSDGMDKFMNRSSTGAIQGVDLIIHLVDSSERTGPEEEQVVKQLKSCGKKIIIGLNKVDVSKGKYVSDYIKIWETARGKPMTEMTDLILFPLSALKAVHIKELIDLIFTELPTGPMLYPDDIITDMPQRMAIADTIREKLFLHMREEIPHSIAVIIDEVLPKKGKVLHIKATIFVERPSQKEIVTGHKGAVLKEVGTEARKDLQIMLEHKVFLELYVKTKEKWRDDYSSLEEMGYIFE